MFDYNKMIQRAIEFFPRWMDIRKRYKTSNGGNLLGAMLDESIKIEEAIQEYIDSYFLETYEGHEDEVMAFSYMAKIGKIDNLGRLSIYYDKKLLMITEDVRIFNKDKYNEFIYYEEGALYIKDSLYEEGVPLTIIIDDDSITEYQLIKHHVWNIFDEFATFVNTRRYEDETNKQLLDRILYITRNLPNSSEKGLKDAIISELMYFVPDISYDEIKIERATPENLIKPYEDFESLLDKMMYVNRDVFKCKRWDFDYWTYNFESINYIPHKWNEVLTLWQNGIGHGSDLEVIISDTDNITDAKLTLFNKSLQAFEKYVYDKDIDYDIDFQLVKYNDILNKSSIKYKLKASELVDITNEKINLHLYESDKVEEVRNAEDLYSYGVGVSIIDSSVIPADDLNWYKIQFKKKDDVDFKITTAYVRHVNDKTGNTDDYKNLITQQPGFLYNAEKELVSANSQRVIKRAEDLNENNGFVTTDNGIEIADNRTLASGVFPLNDYAGLYMNVNYSCEQVDVPKQLIQAKGCYWNDSDEFVIRGDYSIEDKLVEINLEANTFEFEVISTKISGRCSVTVIDNGRELEPVALQTGNSNSAYKFSIKETLCSRPVKIIIETLSFNDVVLGNFKYSSYFIELETDYGKLQQVQEKPLSYLIPSINNNNLNILLSNKTGKKPIIQSINIGDKAGDIVYTTDFIEYKSLCSRKFHIKTTADMTLLKFKPLDDSIIRNSFAAMYSELPNLIYNIFEDNIDVYLTNKIQDLAKTKPTNMTIQQHKELAEANIISVLADELFFNYIKTDMMNSYKNKLFIQEDVTSDIANSIMNYIDIFISKARTLTASINQLEDSFTYAEVFSELNKDFKDISIIDKAEWIRLSNLIAENLATQITANTLSEEIKSFNPRTLYKGDPASNKNGLSYIRLDLSEYESITGVLPDVGKCEQVVESGVVYYNITLDTGNTLSSIKIIGTKNKEARNVPLLDMIRFHIPDFDETYDKVLCSRLLDSVVISRTNSGGTPFNTLIKLGSDMLTGIYVTKYELELPEHIGSRYGNHTLGSNDNPIQYQSFDYIAFYPAGGVIYEAINEYSSYMKDNRDIRIINNFVPALDMNKTLVYTIENINNSEKDKYVIKFHNETNKNDDINTLDTWCIGQQSIAIQNNIDLVNDINYNVNTYDINSKELLSTMIEIKDTYIINKNMILDTSQFMVIPPENMTVKYEEYNGTIEKDHLLKIEEIVIDPNRFNKLVYSNVDSIFHLSKYNPNTSYTIDDLGYTLLRDQGIIIWDNDVTPGTKLYIVYSIKKPVGFLIDLEDLYKAINYDIQAYNELDTILLAGLEKDQTYNVSQIPNIEEVDLVHIECTNPTFEGILKNDVIEFKKFVDGSYILVKSGYYYINGREYFLYSDDKDEDIINNQYYGAENIDISGGEIVTYKPTNNFVTNTEMRMKGKAYIYNYKCDKELKYGVSNLNTLTACDSFNDWTFFAMTPRFVQGLNGLAMNFTPRMKCSYAYLDITDSLIDEEINYISLAASKTLDIFIGEEAPFLDINFNRTLNMVLTEKIPYEGSDIRLLTMIKDPKTRYYLVVQGTGTLDDIIITTEKYDAINGHKKNIDLLGLDLIETKIQGTEYRIEMKDNKDYFAYEAALMSDGYFKTTSKLDWYITKIASFEKEKEFFTCVLNNVNVSQTYITTNNYGGNITTAPIYLNNQSTIKRLIYKINDIELDELSGFNIIAYTSNTYDREYNPIGGFKNNKGFIDGKNLLQYVKFKIEIPANKILDNIHVYAEYKSTDENALKLLLNESGYVESKIYDLQETLDYRLKDLGIDDISNIKDIEIYIRASRDIEKLEIWHEWQRVYINDDLTLKDYLRFYDVRFMQIKILFKTRQSYIKFNHLDVEVI